MIARIPYIFTVVGRLKGQTETDAYEFGAFTDVELTEPKEEDVPVALQIDWTGADDVSNEATWHRWDGRHLYSCAIAERPFTVSDLDAYAAGQFDFATSSEIASFFQPLFGRDVASYVDRERPARKRMKDFKPPRFAEVLWDDRLEQEAWIRDRAQQMFLLGDNVWFKTDEPFYYIPKYVDRRSPAVDIGKLSEAYHPEAFYQMCYRADRRDDALEVAIDTFGIDEVERFTIPNIKVLIPDAVRFDDESVAVQLATKEMTNRMQEYLTAYPLAAMEAWCRLVDLQRSDVFNAEDAVQHIQSLVEALGPDDLTYRKASSILERWNMRPFIHPELPTP